jgi:hypothetical protein
LDRKEVEGEADVLDELLAERHPPADDADYHIEDGVDGARRRGGRELGEGVRNSEKSIGTSANMCGGRRTRRIRAWFVPGDPRRTPARN